MRPDERCRRGVTWALGAWAAVQLSVPGAAGAVSEIDFAYFTPMSGTGLLQIPPGDGTRGPVLQRLPEPASATLALPGSPALFVNRGLRQVKDRP